VIVSGADIRRAAELTLQRNLPGVLGRLERQWDTTLPAPKDSAYVRLNDFIQMTEAQSPGVIITATGLDGIPVQDETGAYEAAWLIRTFVIVRGRSYEETADRVTHYCAAVRAAYAADLSLGGLIVRATWREEKYTELARDRERTIAAGSVAYAFTASTDRGLTGTTATNTNLSTVLLPIHPALEGPP
jgi:hypothetical protein